MTTTVGHRARFTWTRARVEHGLPDVTKYVNPVQEPGISPPWDVDAWSLVCEFEKSPRSQGNPSIAHVRFLVPGAPAHWLHPGRTLWIWEGANHAATIEVLD